MGANTITLEDAAAELGVHYQTAYRWVRSERLPAVKVAGRYRVTRAALDRATAERTAEVPPPRPTSGRLDRQCKAMTRALFVGDETKAVRISDTLRSNGTPVTTLIEQVIAPPLIDIGDAWHQGDTSIYVEHRATAIVERILGGLSPNPRGRRRGVAMVAGLSGELHSLPALMATVALREDAWTVEHLGSDIPVSELDGFLAEHEVDLVVLSATGLGAVDHAAMAATGLRARHRIPVLVGEPGLSLTDLQQLARAAMA